MADRLDRLHGATHAGGIFDVIERAEGVVEVHVDKVLAEARQQALALDRLLATIRQARAAESGDDEDDGLADL